MFSPLHQAPSPSPERTSLPPQQLEGLRQTAKQFESVFLNTMLAEMFKGVESGGEFGGGQAESTYRSLLVEEYANSIAASGGLGLAEDVMRDLIALQEMSE